MDETYISTSYGYVYYDLINNLIYNLYVYRQDRRQGHAGELIDLVKYMFELMGHGSQIKIEANPKENSIPIKDLKRFYERKGLIVINK